MQEFQLQENMLLIVLKTQKKQTIEKIRKQGLCNIKIMSLEELRTKYEFNYNEQAIYYLMKKYHYQYDVAKMYLSHLYEVETEDYGSEKIKKIIQLKHELYEQGLLSCNSLFKEYLNKKKIVLYNCGKLSRYNNKLIEKIKKENPILVYDEMRETHQHKCIWEFETLEDEVSFVADSICELVQKQVSLNQIKLCGVSGEYPAVIQRIFKWYNIPISFQDSSLYSTKMGQDFIEHLKESAKLSLEYLEEKYSLQNNVALEVYNQIINIINRYTWAESLLEIKEFIIEDFKNTILPKPQLQEEIGVIQSLEEASEEEFVYLLGFNQGEIPKAYKDESYFNDELKKKLGLDTTNELNQRNYDDWLEKIKHTKKLNITMKKNSPLGVHYLSSLNDDLKLELIKGEIKYNHSNLYNQIKLTEKLDTLLKYNEQSRDLTLLHNHYQKIPYNTYDSSYRSIDAKKVHDYLQYQLTLSYSAMNSYYQCAFRYYLSNILKINIYEETFYTILGNLFHHILSICFEKEIDLKQEYQNYIAKCEYPFNSREKFFLKNLEKELEFIINTIKEQNETSQLKNTKYEEKIEVDKSTDDMKVVFKGFVDKLMVNKEENILSIVDYKTGSPDLNLNHIIHGLDLQLPVYIYLAKKKFPNAEIAGFYLQKILNNEISRDNKHTYEYLKKEKLKLQGYSNSDLKILEQFDDSYPESRVIKGMRTTSKGIASKKILNSEQINQLENITETKINEAITQILNANFDINPKRIGMDNLGCKFCSYKDVCFMNEKNIQTLKEYKNMEFLGGEENDTQEAC